jgi:hypothetical protein
MEIPRRTPEVFKHPHFTDWACVSGFVPFTRQNTMSHSRGRIILQQVEKVLTGFRLRRKLLLARLQTSLAVVDKPASARFGQSIRLG